MDEPNRISCLLIDDDLLAIRQFEDALNECQNFDMLATFQNPEDFKLAAVQCPPDILFLDVEMPDKNGLDLAKEIQKLNLPSKMVFVSGYRKYAFQAIRIHPFSYLSKPVTPQDLKELAVTYYTSGSKSVEREVPKRIRFNTTNGFLLLDPEKIMSIEADGNYSLCTMDNGQKHLLTCTLKRMGQQLKNPQIIRISRSLMLNLKFLSYVDRRKQSCFLESDNHSFELIVQKVGIKKLNQHMGIKEN